MNASLPTSTAPRATPANPVVVELAARHVHRERDFGIGYGNSSGYATQRRYVTSWGPQRFRCA